jgi:thioredoxin reductase
MHGFLSRDGIHPAELRRIGHEQLLPYGVEFCHARVTAAECKDGGFELTLENGQTCHARKMLIATGVVDHLPEVEGAATFYGRGIFHCPYCDGWEARDLPIAAYGRGKNGAALALSLKTWSADVVLCTDRSSLSRLEEARRLHLHNIPVIHHKIARFEGRERLERIVFHGRDPLPRRAVFFTTGQHQRSDLAARMGCHFTHKGTVLTNRLERSNIPGLWVAGDASRDVQLAIVAAAEGAKAGIAINKSLEQDAGAAL